MANALMPFFILIFVLGLGGANFATLHALDSRAVPTECRGSAIGFTSSVGRFVGVAMVFLVGAGIQRYRIARRSRRDHRRRVHHRRARAALPPRRRAANRCLHKWKKLKSGRVDTSTRFKLFHFADPVLELRDATVVKNDRRILDGLTLTIEAGEHTAIIGPNGAGKSALVSLLTHDDRPVRHEDGSPSVLVFGESRWNVFDLRSQLGIVSADLHHRFVLGNNEGRVTAEAAVLSGFLATQGILRYGAVTQEMRRRAADALTRMGAAHLAKRRLDEMSTGEARRVLLARALVTSPRALILDEPTTGLDLVARHDFTERVRQVARGGTNADSHHPPHRRNRPRDPAHRPRRRGPDRGFGLKRDILTSARISTLFNALIALEEEDGYFYARPTKEQEKV